MTSLSQDDINGVLSTADLLSRQMPDELRAKYPDWIARFEYLFAVPRVTYLPIVCVTLAARALSAEVDVRQVQVDPSVNPRGYSGAAIGKALIPFATSQGINLRSTSTQVMNSQPFTHVKRITADLRTTDEYADFFAIVEAVDALTQEQALEILALGFHLGRLAMPQVTEVDTAVNQSGGVAELERITDHIASFVATMIEGGRVGQALGAALLDVAFPFDPVTVGHINDPSFGTPGDFAAGSPTIHTAGEAKQTPVVTGTVSSFLSQCAAADIDRAVYLALANDAYPDNIDLKKLAKKHGDKIDFRVVTTPEEAIRALIAWAPGTAGQRAKALADRMLVRLEQMGCSPAAIQSLADALNGNTQ